LKGAAGERLEALLQTEHAEQQDRDAVGTILKTRPNKKQ